MRAPERAPLLVREGYEFGSRECARQGADVVEVRLLGRPVTLLRGAAAAQVFYSDRVLRAGALPRRVQRTLVGTGTVQGLDGPAHHARKALFLDVLGPQRAPELVALFEREWRHRLPAWERQGRVVLYDEVAEVLTAAVCAWAGVPLPVRDVPRRTAQLHGLIEGGAAVGPRHWRGRLARLQTERWTGGLVDDVRAGRLQPPEGSALAAWAAYREPGGRLLDARTAGAELLNVLRPTVAADRYVVFAALALHEHPQHAQRLRGADDAAVERFAQEVRRFFPFFPAAGATAARSFSVGDLEVPEGRLVLLDLHGTNHSADSWPDPDVFDPDRPGLSDPDPYALVPQGGGEHATGHRCPGEWVVLGVMTAAVRLLLREMDYRVPRQDLRVRRNRVPAIPHSRLVLDAVRARGRSDDLDGRGSLQR